MGATISYYFHSISFQSLVDYMNSYDTINYYENSSKDVTDINHVNDVNDDFYKLYIYVHDFPEMETIKQTYETNALKHNSVVEKYLKCFADANTDANADADANANTDDNVYCYDSGFDLLCPENIIWTEDVPIFMLDHKISCAMTYNNKPVGYYMYMRSSTPIRTPLRLANNVGIIDSGYRGTIMALFDILYSADSIFEFVKTNRYVQLTPPNIGCPMKVFIVDDLSMLGKKNNRNENGFGSTGN